MYDRHPGHKEVAKFHKGATAGIVFLLIALVFTFLRNPSIILTCIGLFLVCFAYAGYWAKKAIDIDEKYYGDSKVKKGK